MLVQGNHYFQSPAFRNHESGHLNPCHFKTRLCLPSGSVVYTVIGKSVRSAANPVTQPTNQHVFTQKQLLTKRFSRSDLNLFPVETKLEGDSSCLQLIAVREAEPLLPRSCPQWGSPAQGAASSPGGLAFLAYAATVRKLNAVWERGRPRSSSCVNGLSVHDWVSNSTRCWDSSAWKHPNQFLWALWCVAASDAMGHCMFVLCYVLAVGMRETKCTDSVSWFSNRTFSYVPSAWNAR